jgi:hypothetical protein
MEGTPDGGPQDISGLVNNLAWTMAIVDKAIPLRPYDAHEDRTAMRRTAFGILLKELLKYEYTATPAYLESLLPTDIDPATGKRKL